MARYTSGFDPVQDVVAQALDAMPMQVMPTQQQGVVPATTPGSFNLFAGQGAGGFGQGSYGTESKEPRRQTTAIF